MHENNSDSYLHTDNISRFSIQHKTDNRTATSFHSHTGYEIVWLRKGKATYIFKDKVYHLISDHVLFFDSSEFHRIRLSEDNLYERVVLMFTDNFLSFEHPIFQQFKQSLKALHKPHSVIKLVPWKQNQFQQIIDNLLREQNQTELWDQDGALELYLLELLLFIKREFQSSYDTESQFRSLSNSESISLHERILKEINIIWNTEWRLETLAERLHFSKYYLCHFFKKEFGMTIHQYIMQRKIYEAKKLLINTDIPINEIALKIGFSTASNFIRSFKQYVHITPKQYRKSTDIRNLEF